MALHHINLKNIQKNASEHLFLMRKIAGWIPRIKTFKTRCGPPDVYRTPSTGQAGENSAI